ncbi:MAG: Coenzyme F420 hydrogenase/dehydrogenase, beta subunit C-terminal domain [Bacteroidaceae bacterium]
MPILADHNACTGCSACANKCNHSAIEMKEDNTGFLYPVVSSEHCVECGLCQSACPIVTPLTNQQRDPRGFVAQHKDPKVLKESTSGGAFTGIAQYVIEHGGVVFGASYADDFVVVHTFLDSVEELYRFRNSKYVQSVIGDSYKQVKDFLKQDRLVCFSGTPCQIQGLLAYLGKTSSEKLITVDIVCHCVPSPLIFRKYLEYQKNTTGEFDNLVFRDKSKGYSYSTMALYKGSKCVYRRGSESDRWFRAFLHGMCDRPSCESCKAQRWPRQSDITIWDCFIIDKIVPGFDNNKGTTNIITWSDKGREVIEGANCLKTQIVSAVQFKHKIDREYFSDLMSVNSSIMYQDAHSMSSEDFFNKYLPETASVKIKRIIRELLYAIGIYGFIKKILS